MQNGLIVDALSLFKRNVTLHFEGVEACAICYSVVRPLSFSLIHHLTPPSSDLRRRPFPPHQGLQDVPQQVPRRLSLQVVLHLARILLPPLSIPILDDPSYIRKMK